MPFSTRRYKTRFGVVFAFSVALLDYAYHQERQQTEQAIALLKPSTTR